MAVSIFLVFGQESRTIRWFKKVHYLHKKSTTANGPSCVARHPSSFFFFKMFVNFLCSLELVPVSPEHFQRNGISEQFLEIVYRSKSDFKSSTSVSATCAVQ